MIKKEQINFGNIVIMMNKLAQSQETLRSGGLIKLMSDIQQDYERYKK